MPSITINLTSHGIYVFIVALSLLWAGHYWVVRKIFQGSFLKFRTELLDDINGTYLRSKVYEPWKDGVEHRLDILEQDVRIPLIKEG